MIGAYGVYRGLGLGYRALGAKLRELQETSQFTV